MHGEHNAGQTGTLANLNQDIPTDSSAGRANFSDTGGGLAVETGKRASSSSSSSLPPQQSSSSPAAASPAIIAAFNESAITALDTPPSVDELWPGDIAPTVASNTGAAKHNTTVHTAVTDGLKGSATAPYLAPEVSRPRTIEEELARVGSASPFAVEENAPPSAAEIEAPTTNREIEGRASRTETSENAAAAVAADANITPGPCLYPEELDFRDLEEIPESAGPSLWDDAEVEPAWMVASKVEVAGGDPVRSGSSDNNASAVVKDSGTQGEEGTPKASDLGELEGIMQGGRDAEGVSTATAAAPTAAEPPLTMPTDGDMSLLPSSTAAPTTPRLAAQAIAAVGHESSEVGLVQAPPLSAAPEELAHSSISSSHPTERPGLAADDPLLKPTAPEGSTDDTVTCTDPGMRAAKDIGGSEEPPRVEGPLQASVVVEGKLENAEKDGAGRGEEEEEEKNAWLGAAATGGNRGWQRDETGDEFYEEKLKGVVDVRWAFDVTVLLPWCTSYFEVYTEYYLLVALVNAKDFAACFGR